MLARHHDPILAIATAPGRASVGIVRVSGKDLRPLLKAWFGHSLDARHAHYLPFTDAQGALRISTVDSSTQYSAMNTGICTMMGKQPPMGLTFSSR